VSSTSYIADLHIHSLYSRATSKASNLHGLACWAAIKGIQVVGTGDFTHPLWFSHLIEQLEPAEPGFFRLKNPPPFAELASVLPPGVQPDTSGIRFVLSAEISSIYKRGGKVRKIHNILFAPDFDAVRRINTTLAGIGNLESDGRPILGLDAQILLEILLDNATEGFLVPAHIWTPWFSLFGSKSGFDDITECFGDLSSEIFALETGLSSDPEMNRCISALDRFTLISNSDCHSPAKLGREANVFSTGFDFFSMREAIRQPQQEDGEQQFVATIEFYPEEGKYHCDGHRRCGVCLKPYQTVQGKGLCPQCGKPLTIGVLYRVMELADRDEPKYPDGSPGVHSLIPLPEVLGELFNVGPATKKVANVYGQLINSFGSEFDILIHTPLTELATASPMLAEAVKRIRENRVIRKPGFDGEFGIIKVFADDERASLGGQLNLFGITPAKPRKKKAYPKPVFSRKKSRSGRQLLTCLNAEQQAAVASDAPCIIVKAGPGTGKTHTLVQRTLRLLADGQESITVITFTNKAADELRQRLAGADVQDKDVRVSTFHGYCLHWLRKRFPLVQIISPEMRVRLFKRVFPEYSASGLKEIQQETALFLADQRCLSLPYPDAIRPYFNALRKEQLIDLDEIVPTCTALMKGDQTFEDMVRAAAKHLLVDEFQDLNAGQFELVWQLSKKVHVFAIGDPDQAIYGFRGSRPQWFDKFIRKTEAQVHYLRNNYRSGKVLIDAASHLIAADTSRKTTEQPPGVKAENSHSGVLYRHIAADPSEEAAFIATQIQGLIGGTSHREIDQLDEGGGDFALSDIAILYRTAKQAKIIADALGKRSIPCQLVDLKPFFLNGQAKRVTLTLLLAAGRIDKAECIFLLSNEKGIGRKTLQRVAACIEDNSPDPLAEITSHADTLTPGMKEKLSQFTQTIVECQQWADSHDVAAAVDYLLEWYALDTEDTDLIRLRAMAVSTPSLQAFAEHIRRYQYSVVYDDRAEAVVLATLHAAKGLEFAAVFVAGCEDGLLPLAPRGKVSQATGESLMQEERRLFFVGVTRAGQVLYLTSAGTRTGISGQQKTFPSCFIADIPERFFSPVPMYAGKRRKKTTAKQLRLF